MYVDLPLYPNASRKIMDIEDPQYVFMKGRKVRREGRRKEERMGEREGRRDTGIN